MKLSALTISINLMLTALLLPQVGVIGAIIGTLVACIIELCISLYFMIHDIGPSFIAKRSWFTSIIATILSSMVLYTCLSLHYSLVATYVISILSYFILLVLTKEPLLKNTLLLLRENIRRI